MIDFQTADLCDSYMTMDSKGKMQIVDPICSPPGLAWRDFGALVKAYGVIVTIQCFEDNSLVAQALNEDGSGKALIVDAGGSSRCAMLGDRLAQKAVDNHWQVIVVFGMVRDSAILKDAPLVIKALGTHPRKSVKRNTGLRDQVVSFAGITFCPGAYLYADSDGMVVSDRPLNPV